MKRGTLSVRQPSPPFCWQSKIVLKHIRRNVPEKLMPNCLLLYFALTEMASDEHAAEDFRANHSHLAKRCGLSRRTVIRHLQRLESIGVLSSSPNYEPDGQQLPCSILLHEPDKLPKNKGGCETMTQGVCDMTHGGRVTPLIRKKKVVVVSPLTPHGGESSLSNSPALEEVTAYANGANIGKATAERFHSYGTETDWTDSKGKHLRSWKRALLAFAKVDTPPATATPATRDPAPRKATRKPKPNFYNPDHSQGF